MIHDLKVRRNAFRNRLWVFPVYEKIFVESYLQNIYKIRFTKLHQEKKKDNQSKKHNKPYQYKLLVNLGNIGATPLYHHSDERKKSINEG